MSVDFNNTPTDSILNKPSDVPMFGPTPVWERNGKRRRGASPRAAPERATFTAPMGEPVRTAAQLAGDPIAASYAAAPRAETTSRKPVKSGVSPIAIAAGVIVLAGIAGAGFYAAQPRNQGVAQLTPGSAATQATTPVAAAPVAVATTTTPVAPAAPAPVQVASNETSEAPVRRAAPARRAAAPAAAMSAESASADVSATAPATPLDTTDYGVDATTAAAVVPAPAPAEAAPASPVEVTAPAPTPAAAP